MTLVFIHGSGCTAEVFAEQLAAFPESVALTLPGHTTPGSASTIAEFADFVAGELRARNLRNVVLAGSSMGGAIALELGLRGDERIAALVLLGSGAKMRVGQAIFDAFESDFPAATRKIAGYFFAEPDAQRIERAAAQMMAVGKEQTIRDYRACDAFDVSDRLSEVAVPLLALTGERDVLMPPKFAETVATRVPNGQARILSGAGHLAIVERPADTNEAIRAFVTQFGI